MKINVYLTAKSINDGEGESHGFDVLIQPAPKCDYYEEAPCQEMTFDVCGYKSRDKAALAVVAFASLMHPSIAKAIEDLVSVFGVETVEVDTEMLTSYEAIRTREQDEEDAENER